jgi:DNA modification methylase
MKVVESGIYLGDAAKILQNIDGDSVDLIVTSPPYADQRKDTYGGISADKWFGVKSESDDDRVDFLLPHATLSRGVANMTK